MSTLPRFVVLPLVFSATLFVQLIPNSLLADTLRVGSGAGCTHATLPAAFLAAAISAGSDLFLIGENVDHTGAVALNLTSEAPVTFQGSVSCSDSTPAMRTITTTNGDLFEFASTSATFRDLQIRSDPTAGRLLTVSGSGLLTLDDNVTLTLGKETNGGNVHLSGGASMIAFANTRITQGRANNGGGIYCTGSGTVALTAGSRVFDNRADFNGGGVYLTGCLLNLFAGGPVPGSPTSYYGVVDNRADFNGGGIYATSGATVNLLGSSATPASLRENQAEFNGGGLYLTGAATLAEILASEIVDNDGFRRGGGIYATAGAQVTMENDLANCERGFQCSLLAKNKTLAVSGETTEGGAIAVVGGATASIRQTYVTENNAAGNAPVALVDGASSYVLFEGAVLYDNGATTNHVVARNGGHVRVAFSTIWGSSRPGFGMFLFHADDSGRIDLYSSIAIEGRGLAPTGGGVDKVFAPTGAFGQVTADCVIVHSQTGVPTSATVVTDPGLVLHAPEAGDPHLRNNSSAIDYCDTSTYSPVDADIDGEARGVDVAVSNEQGPYDLGADEWDATSTPGIFSDGFESGDMSAWSSQTP